MLFKPEDYERYVCVADEPGAVLDFLLKHGTEESPANRMTRSLRT
jgi:hypothetical protein